MSTVGTAVRWLTPEELSAWIGLQRMQAQLGAKLNRELSSSSDLSLQDYGVLVALTEQPDARLRAFELGRVLGWEKSRLSHHIGRMEKRGLVSREACASDRRGLNIVITPKGRQALEAAAPGHVEQVRRAFIDLLTPAQIASLTDITRTVVDALAAECVAECAAEAAAENALDCSAESAADCSADGAGDCSAESTGDCSAEGG